jgi:transcriptional regulator with XRE-family HTH domain
MFGLRLALERKRLKLNQTQVADLLGTSRSLISMLESDQASMDVARLLSLGEHGFDVLKLLTDEPGQLAAGRLLNWQLCLSITERVDAWCQAHGIELSHEKRAIIVKHLYLQFARHDQIDETALGETLKMAA